MISPNEPCCQTHREEISKAIATIDSVLGWNRPRTIEGIGEIDQILGELGIIAKQGEDLSTPEGFLEWIIRVAMDLRIVDQAAFRREAAPLRTLLNTNWPELTATQLDSAVDEMVAFVAGIREEIVGAQIPGLAAAASQVVGDSKESYAARYALAVIPAFNLRDEEAEAFLVNSTANFMRARNGNISDVLSVKAREVVRNGLEQGLGRRSIARNLQAELGKAQSLSYYDLIAGQYVNRARSWGALRTYQESGIEVAEIIAVLDKRTTDVCRFLNGKYINVGGALDMVSGLEGLTDPEQVKFANPWIHRGMDDQGAFLEIRKKDGPVQVARIIRSGVGVLDDAGEFSNSLPMSDLQVLGIGPPPYHAYCRTSIIPVIPEA